MLGLLGSFDAVVASRVAWDADVRGLFRRAAGRHDGGHRPQRARGAGWSVTHARALVALGFVALLATSPALAWGPVGHRMAGDLAEPKLCPAARTEVKSLGAGESLAELGAWADQIRDEPKWRSSRPWHYMNIADLSPGAGLAEARAAVDKFVHPPEGDVLAALARYSGVLADPKKPRDERAEALRFVVHFVVDIHQPLHVGRALDHGGNDVEVRAGNRGPANLHHFWDTDVLPSKGPSAKLEQRLEDAARGGARGASERSAGGVGGREPRAARDGIWRSGPRRMDPRRSTTATCVRRRRSPTSGSCSQPRGSRRR